MSDEVRRIARGAIACLLLVGLLFLLPTIVDIHSRAREHGMAFGVLVWAIVLVILSTLYWLGLRLTAPSRTHRLRNAQLDLSDLSEETATAKAAEALAKLDRDVAAIDLSAVEREVCHEELQTLEELRRHLVNEEIRIALVGTISSGKSSVVNALLGERCSKVAVRGGTTTRVAEHRWSIDLAKFGRVDIIDTPGLGEVDARQHGEAAQRAAVQSDVCLFVLDADLRAHEACALEALHSAGKPVLVVVNKVDAYSHDQRQELLQVVRERVGPLGVPADHVLAVNADPAPRRQIREARDGSETEVEVQDPPDVTELATKLYEVLANEGRSLVAINALVQADRVREAIRMKIADTRNAEARKLIESYAIVSAAVMALNPLPGIDLLADLAVNAKLAYDLGALRGHRMTTQSIALVIKELGIAFGAVGIANSATKLAASFLKAIPVIGTIGGGLMQGVVSGYTTYVVGLALDHYYKHNCSWGDASARDVVRAATRTASELGIMERVRDQVVRKLKHRLVGVTAETEGRSA